MYYYYHARIFPVRKEAVAFQAPLWVGMTRIKYFTERPEGSKWALQCTNSSILITVAKNASFCHQYPSPQGYSSNQLKTVPLSPTDADVNCQGDVVFFFKIVGVLELLP